MNIGKDLVAASATPLVLAILAVLAIIGGILSLMLIIIPLSAAYSWMGFGIIWCGLLITSGLVALRRTLRELRDV